ncbi:MAG: family 10 glycosylhydrolase [Muribaculaceae bacterium]|nr:family 10 glycosylhydrolase [Muribaculaceae bacterium]
MTKRFFIAIIAITLFANVMAEVPKREWRSTWLATVANIDWPRVRGTSPEIIAQQKQGMIDYLDGLRMMNMNAICFQVRSMCDAMYQSSFEPWSSYLTGTRGTDPGWDPLAFVVEECHKRGMDCYAWVNPYRWSHNGTNWKTDFDNSLKERGVLLTSEDRTYLNPGLPEVREHIVKVCNEIITKYDVQGLIFDDYFYPNSLPANESAGDYNLWKESGSKLSLSDWRRANVDQMVKDVYDMIQECRPDLRYGISPASAAGRSAWKYGLPPAPFAKNDWQYEGIYSDPLSWLNSGTIDFISPQEYYHTDDATKPFEQLADWWDEMATHFGRHHYTSLSISCLADDNSQSHWDEHVNQTLIARQLSRTGANGVCYFSTKYLNGPSVTGAGEYFKEKLFSRPSLNPILDWKKGTNYAPVSGLLVNNDSLKWNVTVNGNAIIRYTVYAVPNSISYYEALTNDGISNEYLLGVSYSTEYSLLTEYSDNHWYAVCIYDGYGRESRPAIVGYNGGVSQTVNLLTPTNGVKVDWACAFSWTTLDNSVYTLEIASDKDFKDIIFSQSWIEMPNIALDLGFMEDNKEYFWRVISIEDGKFEAVSEASAFISPTRKDAVKANLISPKDGENINTDITFKWEGDENADNFTLQISPSTDFAEVIYQVETTDCKVEIPSAFIGLGTHYWRIISEGTHVNRSVSEYSSFVVTEVGVGNFEEGYEIKNDTYNYPDNDGISVKNLWMRSVRSEFANISFEDNGKLNRTFIAKDGYVYLAGRTENSSTASVYLRKFNGVTGEHVEDKYIYNSASANSYPCNTITKDSKGNVCIANMSTRIDSVATVINHVDLKSGWATPLCYLTCPIGGRADNISIYGDILSDKYYVFAAIKDTNKVVRWTVTGNTFTNDVCELKAFYPKSATALGTAPLVTPITENDIMVDGTTIYPTRYNFATGEITESFAEKTALAPSKASASGVKFFTLAEKTYMAHAYNHYNANSNPSNVQIVSIDNQIDFSSMKALCSLPQSGLGTVSIGTLHVLADFVQISDNKGMLYVYSPGNGLSAYELTDSNSASVINIIANNHNEVEYFNLQGMKINQPSSGIYIMRQGNKVTKIIRK